MNKISPDLRDMDGYRCQKNRRMEGQTDAAHLNIPPSGGTSGG